MSVPAGYDTVGALKALGAGAYAGRYDIVAGIGDDDDVDAKQSFKYLPAATLVLGRAGRASLCPPMNELFDEALAEPSQTRASALELERHNAELCRFVAGHAPYKQFLRMGLAFLLFFSAILTIQSFSGLWLIAPLLAWLGIGLSASTVLLSWLARLDWKDWRSRERR